MSLFFGWLLLSIPVFIFGGAVISLAVDEQRPTSNGSVLLTVLGVMPAWWGVYFLIVAFR